MSKIEYHLILTCVHCNQEIERYEYTDRNSAEFREAVLYTQDKNLLRGIARTDIKEIEFKENEDEDN